MKYKVTNIYGIGDGLMQILARKGWAISWSEGDMPCYQGECDDVTEEDLTGVRLYNSEAEAQAEIDRNEWHNCAAQWVELV